MPSPSHSVRGGTATTTDSWWWKVLCAAGAVVRQGVDLKSKHTHTLPFGTHVIVLKKIINQDGLSRLFVRAAAVSGRIVEGWCSEFLNPLSGQRGPILKPIPPAVPVFYRVVLPDHGAMLRQHVELGSPMVQTAAVGSRLAVLHRAFTEFPAKDCVPRLQVAWASSSSVRAFASLRLNNEQKSSVLAPTGTVDSTFDPRHPGLYFWRLYQSHDKLRKQETKSTKVSSGAATSNANQPSLNPTCVVCLTGESDATLVHGETGHICCCLECARVCKAQGVGCPICREPIDRIILHYYS
uniref:RING-type domain-containing protein n=1 Tax=Entomoneis paludosa TaxID=265537 RepID=A0A7S2YI78_9STRA|mmetsp:Transcript_34129/g.71011  ORF Transcript_34129/g.71011 Transcript_34129/m.71011 type:complete len:296 (+) Transcript_34129:490-1377(+)